METSITFMLPQQLKDDIHNHCRERSLSVSSFLREAAYAHLKNKNQSPLNTSRVVIICEFLQLVADEWLRQNAPEKREDVISAVDARLEKYHGK